MIGAALVGAMLACAPADAAYRGWKPPVRVPPAGQLAGGNGGFTSADEVIATWTLTNASELHVATRARDGVAFTDDQVLGTRAYGRQLLTDDHGGALLVWGSQSSPGGVLTSARPAGGAFGPAVQIASTSEIDPKSAMNGAGDAVISYAATVGGVRRVMAVRRAADGTLGPPEALGDPTPAGEQVEALAAAISADGTATFLWRQGNYDHGDGGIPWRLYAARWRPGQAPGAAQPLSTAGRPVPRAPQLASDAGGDTVAAWVEPTQENAVAGRLMLATASGVGGFGAAVDLGDEAGTADGAVSVALTPAGAYALVYAHVEGHPGGSGTLGAGFLRRGDAAAGTLGPTAAITGDMVEGAMLATIAPNGDAVAFYRDFRTSELRAVRLPSSGGARGPEVIACPQGYLGTPSAAKIEASGRVSLLWNQSNGSDATRGLQLSQDRDRDAPWPGACPGPYLLLAMSPGPPVAGAPVTFDASAAMDPDSESTSFAWDLDGDGSFETDTGFSPVATHVYPVAQTLTLRLRVTNRDAHGQSASQVHEFTLYVAATAPPGGGGGGAVHIAPVPPGTAAPFPIPILNEPIAPVATAPPASADPPKAPVSEPTQPASIGVSPHASLRTVLRSGVAVRVHARRPGTVRLRLVLPAGAHADRRARVAAAAVVLATRTVRVRAGQQLAVRLRLDRAARRALPAATRTTLELRVDGSATAASVKPIVVRR